MSFGRPVHHDRLQLENWRTCRECVGQTATRQQARKPQIPTRDHPTIRSKNGVFFWNLFFKRPYLRKRGTGRGRDGRTGRPGRLAVHPKSFIRIVTFLHQNEGRCAKKWRGCVYSPRFSSGHFGSRAPISTRQAAPRDPQRRHSLLPRGYYHASTRDRG